MSGKNTTAIRALVTAASTAGFATVTSANGLYIGARGWLSNTAQSLRDQVEITDITGNTVGLRIIPASGKGPSYGRSDISAYNTGGFLDVDAGLNSNVGSAGASTLGQPGDLSVLQTRNESRFNDVLGRMKVSRHQNIYEADFEYGPQPLRWESLTVGGGSVTHLPMLGGVRMRLTTAAGDVTIRQSRPYHRYQPGKTMFMSTAVNFGIAQTNQVQRVGLFDDSNGVFVEQANPTTDNPSGMAFVVRSDASGTVTDTRFQLKVSGGFSEWNGDAVVRDALDWTRIQMIFVEFAWYGAGAVRWGVMLGGEPIVLHQIGFGNRQLQTGAWSRTGNLPARYEQRNIGAVAAQNDMIHYGVSVLVEGGVDDQRGFTYAYGLPQSAPRRTVGAAASRFPLLSIRGRTMGVSDYTQATAAITAGTTTSLTAASASWTVNQWAGRSLNYIVSGVSYTARITSNTATVLTIQDVVTGGALAVAPVAGQNYTIGIINRGQLLPRRLQLVSDQPVFVEIFVSTPTSPVNLTGASFTANAAATNSFALIDSAATVFTLSGEVVYSLFVPANNPVDQLIDNLFPLVNSIRGASTDIMTIAVTNPGSSALVSCQIIGQEAMS